MQQHADLLLAAVEADAEGVGRHTAALAPDQARPLLALQAPGPGPLADVIHQGTKVLQRCARSGYNSSPAMYVKLLQLQIL